MKHRLIPNYRIFYDFFKILYQITEMFQIRKFKELHYYKYVIQILLLFLSKSETGYYNFKPTSKIDCYECVLVYVKYYVLSIIIFLNHYRVWFSVDLYFK